MPTTPQMIIIFAMVLTFAMFICSAFSAATATQQSKLLDNNETAAEDASREPSNLLRFVFTELPLVHHCNDSSQCPAAFGFTRCENHLCMCDESFYQVFNKTSETAYCRLCSMFQESCSVTQCCENPHATFCFNGLCVCRPGMDEECISGIYRGRYTPTLGIQLANTLSVSFAFVFLAITFIAVIRKTLFRCSFCRSDSMSRVSSDSSLNEFVKQKMQNRPPCYDDIEKDRKVPIFDYTNQPPPEYGATHFSRPGTFLQDTPNTSLSISNVVEMHMAPPNYSTFTTVTEVSTVTPTTTNAGDAIGRTTNDEIILTQPIYANREFSRLALGSW